MYFCVGSKIFVRKTIGVWQAFENVLVGKGRDQCEMRRFTKMANDRNMLGMVVINVLISFIFAAILD